MTLCNSPLRKLFQRFFPRKHIALPEMRKIDLPILSDVQKKDLAARDLMRGEIALLQGNLNALSHFESATQLDGQNKSIWYRQGLAFFEYGSEEGKEKALHLAGKSFKMATQIDPTFFEAWIAWGNVLLQLGRFYDEHHYLIESKDKYQKALEFKETIPKEQLAELYWDYGIAWAEIAKHSGEALDIRLAIVSLEQSQKMQESPAAEFWHDSGKAYLEMGLLINDTRLHSQAIDFFQKSVKMTRHYFEGWSLLAEAHTQIYINTLDESHFTKAMDAFETASKLRPNDADIWLSWAQLLGLNGQYNRDQKNLRLSIEKCARANKLSDEPAITAQWIESLSHLGRLQGRLDLILEAEQKALHLLEQYDGEPDTYYAYGCCLIAFAHYYEDPDFFEQAIEKLQIGLSIDRSDPELWHAIGMANKAFGCVLSDVHLMERAVRFLLKANDLKPACPMILFDLASSWLKWSELINDASILDHAISLFESLLLKFKEAVLDHPEWLFEYAVALDWWGELTGEEFFLQLAIDMFTHVLLIDPDFPEIYHKIALSYVSLGLVQAAPENFKKALYFYRIASKQNEENDVIWLDFGICSIHLAQFTPDADVRNALYTDAEYKISKAGLLGNPCATYMLACVYSIVGRLKEANELIQKAFDARSMPSLEELLADEWLENARATSEFAQFQMMLEAKLQQTREE